MLWVERVCERESQSSTAILYGIETHVDSAQGTLTRYKDSLMGLEEVSGVEVNSVTF